jgi:hypothetical protein
MNDPHQSHQHVDPSAAGERRRRRRSHRDGGSDGGSPWQAMKRLRVAETADSSTAQQQQVAAAYNSSDAAVATTASVASTEPWQQWRAAPAAHLDFSSGSDSAFKKLQYERRQDAGQDTMSEGFGSPPRSTTTQQHQHPVANHPSSAATSDDMDYQSVNHILGALHLERRHREHQPELQQQRSNASSHYHHHHHQQAPTAMQQQQQIHEHPYAPTPPPATNPSRFTNNAQQSYSWTPPPKPAKRKIVHLATNSKLG